MWSPQRHLFAGRVSVIAALILAATLTTAAANARPRPSTTAVQASAALAATIFSFDGQDFVRTKTTLVTETGASAVGTKLDRGSQAFKALLQKHSGAGPVTVFGKNYNGTYAPLIDKDGRLTGALFVGVPK
jgi:hypothetical protein